MSVDLAVAGTSGASAHRQQSLTVAILACAVGVMCFEQASPYYLMPFLQPSLQLSNAQIGTIVGAYCVVFAVSSQLASSFASATGRYKAVLVLMTAALSLGTLGSAVAGSFIALLAARCLMGILEGPMFPIAQSFIALQSPAERRGMHMGIVGSFAANAFGYFLAPLVLVRIAVAYGWRAGFVVIVAPGLLCALMAARWLQEPSLLTARTTIPERTSIAEVFGSRNVWLCALICCCYVAYNTLGFTFQPLFYVRVRQMPETQMSLLMGMVGIAAMLASIVLPWLADRLGRKPALAGACFLSVLSPLAALYLHASLAILALVPLLGWLIAGAGSLFMGTIPSESLPAHAVSTAMGFIVGFGVLVGGLLGPTIAGACADRWGLQAAMHFQLGCALISGIAAWSLHETRR